MAQGMDSLKIALANMCDLIDRQLELIVDEKFNAGLTPNLIPYFDPTDPEAGLHHGFKGMQLSCSALTAEALKLCNPASIHSRSTEAHNQDKVSMGTIAARDARTIVEIAQHIAAIHLIALAQALDLRGIEQASPKVREAHALVRARVAFLDGDRRMDRDIDARRRAHPLGRAFRRPGVGGVARDGPRLRGPSPAHCGELVRRWVLPARAARFIFALSLVLVAPARRRCSSRLTRHPARSRCSASRDLVVASRGGFVEVRAGGGAWQRLFAAHGCPAVAAAVDGTAVIADEDRLRVRLEVAGRAARQ